MEMHLQFSNHLRLSVPFNLLQPALYIVFDMTSDDCISRYDG